MEAPSTSPGKRRRGVVARQMRALKRLSEKRLSYMCLVPSMVSSSSELRPSVLFVKSLHGFKLQTLNVPSERKGKKLSPKNNLQTTSPCHRYQVHVRLFLRCMPITFLDSFYKVYNYYSYGVMCKTVSLLMYHCLRVHITCTVRLVFSCATAHL